jgi:hypothetical protein
MDGGPLRRVALIGAWEQVEATQIPINYDRV